MHLSDYPVLVFADDGPMSGAVHPKVHLFVAAVVPEGAQAGAAPEHVAALRRTVGEPELQEAGLLVRMSEMGVAEVQANPESLADLRPALETMVQLVRALDAPPAEPI
jgi:hypothetical protein